MTDIMSPEKRSAVMSRIRGKHTGIELQLGRALSAYKLTPELHARDLPGCPDFVFRDTKVAVFVDGDFWHGWRFPTWSHKLTPIWFAKIDSTRRRDRRNAGSLRRRGWRVIRIWEHQLSSSPDDCVRRVLDALQTHPDCQRGQLRSEP